MNWQTQLNTSMSYTLQYINQLSLEKNSDLDFMCEKMLGLIHRAVVWPTVVLV